MLIFDTETNGFLKDLHTIHCLVTRDTETGIVRVYNDQDYDMHDEIAFGVRELMNYQAAGGTIVGHNAIKFDVPVIQKLFPWFKVNKWQVLDTLNLTRLLWPDLRLIDHKLFKQGKLAGNLQKRHSLEAWGQRLGCRKSDYKGDPLIADEKDRYARRWEKWNPTMEDYCVQDTATTAALLAHCQHHIEKKGMESAEAVTLEHQVQWIIARQERHGVEFDVRAATNLYSQLVGEKLIVEGELAKQFGTFYLSLGKVITKRSARYQVEELGVKGTKGGKDAYHTMDFTEGVEYTKVKCTTFNAGSRDHIANRLTKLFGWEPTEFTDDGKPKIDESVLSQLTYPQVDGLKRYLMLSKRIGQISEGKESWLKHEKDGVIRCSVTTNGAVTGRMTHAKINITQVPATNSPYGTECRSLFVARAGKVFVGADASALELCDLAGYMARFDEGAYVDTVLKGDKSLGTDIHSVNARALGLDPKKIYFDGESGRDMAKTWFYAFIYGAGDEKLGIILTKKRGQIKAGKDSRANMLRNLPALGQLVKRVKAAVKVRGCLRGLDGRVLASRSQHSALNTLLQSAGAVQMKKALVLLDEDLVARGYRNTESTDPEYEFVINAHDEWQIECNPELGDIIGKAAVAAIKASGEHFKFRCPLDGAYSIGRNWAETH